MSTPLTKLLVGRRRDNGIYYFLGNLPAHVSHALPLYEKLGGTFIVLSQAAYEACRKLRLPVVMYDDRPDLFLQFSADEVSATLDFISQTAKVVIFYDIFTISQAITVPQIMLTHGNSLKDFYIEWRRPILPHYRYIASLGPESEARVRQAGATEEQMLQVGLARGDQLIRRAGQVRGRRRLARKLGLDPSKPMVAYMPTWWGPTSANDTGKTITRYISEEYSFLFRPHPSTPPELINEYLAIIDQEKLNAAYVPDGRYEGVDLCDVYEATSVFIGDMSSVTFDVLLMDKPLIFAFGSGDRAQAEAVYRPLGSLYDKSLKLRPDNAASVNEVIAEAMQQSLDQADYRKAKEQLFYGLDGSSTAMIARSVRALLQEQDV